MKAEEAKRYVHVVDGVVRGDVFDATTLPEWNDEQYPCVEVPDGVSVVYAARHTDGVFQAPEVRRLTIEEARVQAHGQIDAAAGRARLRYITDIPGQQAVYLLKGDEADDFRSREYKGVVPPTIAAIAEVSGDSPGAIADRIAGTRNLWVNVIGPRIEGLRDGGKMLVAAAQTSGAVEAISIDIVAQLEAI